MGSVAAGDFVSIEAIPAGSGGYSTSDLTMHVAPEPPQEPSIELERLRASVRGRLFGDHEQGVRIGRYRLERCIGRGGMGVVWAARDDELDRTVAIKLLRPELSGRGIVRLDKEAKALARLSHPNVVSVFDVGTHDGSRFIAMEFVEGDTLRTWLATPRSVPEVLAAFIGAGRGLAAAHAVGLVHRDFKPDNVLIGVDGRPRVLDFGLARPPSGAEARPPAVDLEADPKATAVSQYGVLLGTPAYMAPEQHLGEPADARSDQFSFAVALFEALYGEPPFDGEDLRTLSLAVVRGRVTRRQREGVGPALEAALLRSLSADAADRFDSVQALLDVLGGEAVGAAEAAPAPMPTPVDRFHTAEVQAVLQRAAQLQASAGTPRPGLSAAELESVAAEAGIDPQHARAAAKEMTAAPVSAPAVPERAPAIPPAETHAGMRTDVHAVRQLATRPTGTAMQHIVKELERTEGKGRVVALGDSMTWTGRKLEVHVDPTRDGGSLMLWRKMSLTAIRRAWTYSIGGAFLAIMVTMPTVEGLGLLHGPNDGWVVLLLAVVCTVAVKLARKLARRVHANDLERQQARLDFRADRLVALTESTFLEG